MDLALVLLNDGLELLKSLLEVLGFVSQDGNLIFVEFFLSPELLVEDLAFLLLSGQPGNVSLVELFLHPKLLADLLEFLLFGYQLLNLPFVELLFLLEGSNDSALFTRV